MANIKITVEGPLMDGHKVTFKAPCNCSVVEKLDVRYIENNTQKSKLFTMKDAHGNDLTGLGNLFSEGAYVDVVLDTNSGSAYLQNAGTNGYLEERLKTAGTPVDNLESDRADLPLSARQGKVLKETLNKSLTNEDSETFNFGIKDGVRGYFTNPSRADDSFIPFSRNKKLLPKVTTQRLTSDTHAYSHITFDVTELTSISYDCASSTYITVTLDGKEITLSGTTGTIDVSNASEIDIQIYANNQTNRKFEITDYS